MEGMDVHNLIPFTRQTAGETTAHFITRRDRDLAEVKKNMQHFGFTTVLEYIKYLQSEVEKVNTRHIDITRNIVWYDFLHIILIISNL